MSPRPIRIVLVRPRNPLNIGACARAMANFGLSELVVVDPFEPIWKETCSAPGAEELLKMSRVVASWKEAVKGCPIVLGTSSFHQRPLEQAVIKLPKVHRYLASFPARDPLAIVFGSERSGLSNEELVRCQAILHIPTGPPQPSMNLGQAVAVTLYELQRPNREPSTAPRMVSRRPSAQKLELLIENLAALGQTVDYPPGYAPAARLGRIRQALQGTVLPPAAVRLLLSFVRWLQKKVPSKE